MTREEYQEYLNSPHWQEIRIRQLEKDNHTCQRCGSKDNLEVHHTCYTHGKYSTLGKEKVGADIITLCSDCHRLQHRIRDKYYAQAKAIHDEYVREAEKAIAELALRYYDRASTLSAQAALEFLGNEKRKNKNHLVNSTCTLLDLVNTGYIPICCKELKRSPEEGNGKHGVYNDTLFKLSRMHKKK